jgi:SAM-dependent methyltransferase
MISGRLAREYFPCPGCGLIFVDEKHHPSPKTAKARYATHQNNPGDAGYLAFLNQALTPALPHLQKSRRGLDYGCGPSPVLVGLLRERGYSCTGYDPLFFPALPPGPFDFIFATEVLEHLHHPRPDLEMITRLLAPDGIFTIMTEPWTSLADFPGWHYTKDFTHVCFYHFRTIDYICKQYGFQIIDHRNPRVWVLKKISL